MKTMRILLAGALALALLLPGLTSCKKDKNKTDTSSMQQLVKDDNRVKSADDGLMNDVNDVLSAGGNKSMNGLPCNVNVDSSNVVNDTITYYIHFTGNNCHNTYSRVGEAEVRKNVNTPWSAAGTRVYVRYINVLVTRLSTGTIVTLNGTRVWENVSGGLLAQLGSGLTSVVHRLTGSLVATFDDGTTRTWSYARQRTFTGVPGDLVCTVEGLGSADGYSGLTSWGVNRGGDNFYTQITQSVVHRQTCGWDPVSGIKIHNIPGALKKATVTFGYDDNEQPVPLNSGSCPTKCRIDWESNGNTGTLYISI